MPFVLGTHPCRMSFTRSSLIKISEAVDISRTEPAPPAYSSYNALGAGAAGRPKCSCGCVHQPGLIRSRAAKYHFAQLGSCALSSMAILFWVRRGSALLLL